MIFMRQRNRVDIVRADQIIIEPVLTEKTNLMKEGTCAKYAFRVHDDANKFEIMDAVYKLFSVKPESCNIVTVKAKTKTRRTRSGKASGMVPQWKKAIVTLAKGDRISAFEGV